MNKLRWLAVLMGAVIVIITGFQAYWLKDNYDREKKTTVTRANLLFRETVRDMQDSILELKLQQVFKDSKDAAGVKRRLLVGTARHPFPGIPGAARVISVLGQKMLADSLKDKGNRN